MFVWNYIKVEFVISSEIIVLLEKSIIINMVCYVSHKVAEYLLLLASVKVVFIIKSVKWM